DGAQQFLLWRQLGLTFRGDLAHQDVTGSHLGADVDDARFVEPRQRRLAHIGNIGGDFLRPQLGVPRGAGQLLDVDGGKSILLHYSLRDQDGVFKVVAVPGHERNAHVLAKRQLTEVDRRAVSQNVAFGHYISTSDNGTLI